MTGIPTGPVPPQGAPGQPPQGPQGPSQIGAPRVPMANEQQPDTPAAAMGSDAPMAFGALNAPDGATAPPAWDGWLPPQQLPGSHAEQKMVLDRMKQEWGFFLDRRLHQQDVDIMAQVQGAPGQADQLLRDIRMQPDVDFGAQLDELEPFLPKSKAKHLRTSHDRVRKIREKLKTYEGDVESALRGKFRKDVYSDSKDVERRQQRFDSIQKQIREITDSVDPLIERYAETIGGKLHAGTWPEDVQKKIDEYESNKRLIAQLEKERDSLGVDAAPAGVGDAARGLGSFVTGKESVEDDMLSMLGRIRDESVPAVREGYRNDSTDVLRNPTYYTDKSLGMTGPDGGSGIPGVTRAALRAAMSDVAIGKVAQLKRDTSAGDMLGTAAGVVPWAVTGMGEIALAGKAVNALSKSLPWLRGTGRMAKFARGAMTYAVGPGAMEFSYGMVRDLPGSRQAELDAIEDPKLREATESAYRWQQATLDATMAVAFSIGDIARAARSSETLRHIVNNPGRALTDAAKLGLIAPAAAEGTNVLVGEAAKLMAANEGEASDVLRDLYAAKGMYGPVQQILDAKSGDELMEGIKSYAKQALPMMAGVATVHAMTGFGVKFNTRREMLAARRDVAADIEKADLEPEAKQALQRVMDQQLEELTPSKQEDERARNRATAESLHGDLAASRVMAERLSAEWLKDAPGKNLSEKLDLLRQARNSLGDEADNALRNDLDIAETLDMLRHTSDRGEAEQMVAELQRIMGDEAPIDELVEANRLADNLASIENPARDDAALRAVAEEAEGEWRPVGRDDDAGTVTLRQDRPGDAPIRRKVPEDQVSSHRIAAEEARPRWADATPELEQMRSGDLTPQQFVNRVVKRLDAAGDEAWGRFASQNPELRGSRKKPSKKAVRRRLLQQAKDYAEQLGVWKRPDNPNAGNLKRTRRGRDVITEIAQLGGLSEAEWRAAGVDVEQLRGHPRRGELVRGNSTNRWGQIAESLRDTGYLGRRGDDTAGGGSGSYESEFGEVVHGALGGDRVINWDEGGMSQEAMQADYEDWLRSSMEPEPQKVVDDTTAAAIEAIRGGATSGRALADAVGISRDRAGKILKEMFSQGMLVKKGRGYELAPEADKGMTREADARRDEADQITQQLLEDAAEIAEEFGRTGDSTTLPERAARMANDLADYGDLVRPDDPQQASAELASRVLLELPPEARTDEVIRQLGMGETDVPIVREFMRQRENPRPVAGMATSLSPEKVDAVDAVLEGRTRLDKAMQGPTLEGLPEEVRLIYDEATRSGAEDAAEQAWAVWRDLNPDAPERPLSSEIERHSAHLDRLNRDIVTHYPERQQQAVTELSDLVGAIRESDEWTGLLSLTEQGRAYLQRLNALWHGLTVKREVAVLPAGAGGRKRSTAAERRAKAEKILQMRREGEKGSVPVLAPAVILVSPALAAYAVMRAGMRTMAKVMRHGLRLAARAIGAAKWPLTKLADLWTGKTRIERLAGRYELRAATAESRNVGKYGEGRGIIDNQTKWGEIDLVMAYERAAFYSKIASEASARLNRVLQEDSQFDHDFNRALEILGTAKEKRQADDARWIDDWSEKLTEEQRDVVDAVREMYGSIRQLVAGELLPTQQQRRRDMRLLQQLVAERQAVAESMADAIGEAGDKKAVDRARRAHKKAVEAVEKAEARLDRLRTEAAREKARWGITDRGFAPAVPNRDPSEAIAEARARGKLSEDEVIDLEVQGALRDLAATSAKLKERAHDFVHSEIPPAPRAGHWMTRKGTLEAAGAREASGIRSFLHYVKEVYRLIPAAQWHERHYERLWGTEKLVSASELDSGKLEGGGHVVEYLADNVAPSARRRTKWRLGGSAYGLQLVRKGGAKQTVWFRTYQDWKAARASTGDKVLGDGWEIAEKQNGAKHHLLLHHEARAGADMPVDIGTDKATRRLLLSDHDVRAVLPTNAVGSYVKKVGGKYAAIRRMSGKKTANQFSAYVDQSMQRIMGRELLTKAERFGASFSSVIRHKLLGMLQPSSAIKEAMDNFLSVAIHSGVEGAFDASYYALTFSKRLSAAERKLNNLSTRKWLEQHTPNQKGDILPPSLIDGMKTPEKELAKMTPEQRQEAQWLDESFVAFLKSALSGDSISEHLGVVKRQGAYGQKMYLMSGQQEPGVAGSLKLGRDIVVRGAHKAGDASWFLRRRAQSYGMRMTWIGAYMAERKAGKSDAQAVDVANRFALAQGNVGNRISQAEFFQTWFGRMIKPLASWSLATSASNWRQVFHGADPGSGVKVVAMTAAKRMAYLGGMLYVLQQMGLLFDLDVGNSVGGKLSQVPLVGPMASYSAQELLSKLQWAADPADASRQLPAWRQRLVDQAREHAPDFLREYLVRRAATFGGFPADVPLPVLPGTWSPYVADAAQDFYTALITPDEKRRDQALHNLVGANFDWFRAWNRLYQTSPDPSDPNYLLVKNPTTGHMQERVRKGEEGAAIWNLLMPDLETSVRRIERGILQPRRDELRAAATRNIAYRAQDHLIKADQLRDELGRMTDEEQRGIMEKRIRDLQIKFNQAVHQYATENEMGLRDEAAVHKRWAKVARANVSLTGRERDIINAYDTDTAFRLWAGALDDVSDPMTKLRFDRVQSLRYSSLKEMFEALAKQTRDTQRRFLDSYRTARVRWSTKR